MDTLFEIKDVSDAPLENQVGRRNGVVPPMPFDKLGLGQYFDVPFDLWPGGKPETRTNLNSRRIYAERNLKGRKFQVRTVTEDGRSFFRVFRTDCYIDPGTPDPRTSVPFYPELEALGIGETFEKAFYGDDSLNRAFLVELKAAALPLERQGRAFTLGVRDSKAASFDDSAVVLSATRTA